MFNFPLKVCDIICSGKAEGNLRNLNFLLVNQKVKVRNIDGDKL